MKRPVVIVLLAMILGECVAITGIINTINNKTQVPEVVILLLLYLAVLFVCILSQSIYNRICNPKEDYNANEKITTKRIFFLVVIFSFCVYGFQTTNYKEKQCECVYKWGDTENVTVLGTFTQCQETKFGFNSYIEDATIATQNSQVEGVTVIMFSSDKPDLKWGNCIKFTGENKKMQGAPNIGNFDSRGYYKSVGVVAQVKLNRLDNIKVESDYCNYVREYSSIFRNNIVSAFDIICNGSFMHVCNEDKASILKAVTVGEKKDLDEEIKELYKNSGISHVLAISGLHISAIGVFIYKLFRKKYKFVISGVASTGVVLLFVFMSGGGISSIRASGMFIFYLLTQMLGRKYDMINSMAFVAVAVCGMNPFVLLNSAFQMSFGAIVGVAAIKPEISRFTGIETRKKHSKEEIQKQKHLKMKIKLMIGNIITQIVQGIVLSISVNIILIPVIAYNYFEIPVYSILLNILVVPMMIFVIGPALWSAMIYLCGTAIGIPTVIISRMLILIACLVLEFYECLCRVCVNLPHNTYLIGRPECLQIVVYYVLLIVFLLLIRYVNSINRRASKTNNYRKKKLVTRFMPVSVLIVVLSSLILLLSYQPDRGLMVMFNNVGQGDCILIRNKELVVMVDCGSSDVKKVAQSRIVPTLKAHKINKIDYVFLSHGDNDHINGAIEMLEDSSPNRVKITNVILSSAIPRDDAYEKIASAADEAGCTIEYISSGDAIRFEGLKINCLYPNEGYETNDGNDSSTILDVRFGQFSLLLTGDISSKQEEQFLGKVGMNYTILKAAHHGSKYSTSSQLLEKITPKITIVSCGKGNSYGHPHQELIDRLKTISTNIMRTDYLGQIKVTTKDGKMLAIYNTGS